MNVNQFLSEQFKRVSAVHAAKLQARELVPAHAKQLFKDLEEFAAGTHQNFVLREKLSVAHKQDMDEAGEEAYEIRLRVGGWLMGYEIAGANIGKKIEVGPMGRSGYNHLLAAEQTFELTQIEEATIALMKIAEREIIDKKLIAWPKKTGPASDLG